MHLLTVFAHPFRDKHPAAVMDAFHEPSSIRYLRLYPTELPTTANSPKRSIQVP